MSALDFHIHRGPRKGPVLWHAGVDGPELDELRPRFGDIAEGEGIPVLRHCGQWSR